jgi:hypothetical protein
MPSPHAQGSVLLAKLNGHQIKRTHPQLSGKPCQKTIALLVVEILKVKNLVSILK